MGAEAAQITYGADIAWAGGRKFNGFVVLNLVLPTGYTGAFLKDSRPKLRVPTSVRVSIREGKYETETKVWRTDSLTPPGVVYDSFFYDDSGKLISAGPSAFAVTTSVHTLSPPVLPDPV